MVEYPWILDSGLYAAVEWQDVAGVIHTYMMIFLKDK